MSTNILRAREKNKITGLIRFTYYQFDTSVLSDDE